MRFITQTTHFDFLGRRKLAFWASGGVSAVAIFWIVVHGLAFGIDFTGGVLVEVEYPQAAELQAIRRQLAEAGYESALVQNFGTSRDVLIRLMPRETEVDSDKIGEELVKVLKATEPEVALRRAEFVGPQVGEELAEQGALALLFALLMILAYVAFRFQWKFAVGAIIATIHDVIVTVGLFSIFQLPFDLSVLAAVLAVIGYSLNDTVVVFDRIRENFLRMRSASTFEVMNASINQTLSRTIITGITTLLVLAALFFLGGETLRGFSLALIVGILIGTYSSVYIASATALELRVSTRDLMPPQRDERSVDGLP